MAIVPRFARSGLAVVLGCALFLALTAVAAPGALAHDRLKSSSPAKDAKVSELKEVELEFTSNVKFPVVVLRGPGDKAVKVDKPETGDQKVTTAVPGPLESGRYVIAWRVVSSDGHPIEGEIPFELTAPAQESAEPSDEPTSEPTAEPSSGPATEPASPVAASGDDTGGQGGTPGWIWLAVAAVVVVGGGVWLAIGRKRPDEAG
ncbi:copper resistance protein CopC [Spongiactinospora sp. 9N601]|uniref:copper resistance protein CopC n=1 Tax=Spongiactinospora sp. 9N601 TaxID=3375149 RepID=UPI0037B1601C